MPDHQWIKNLAQTATSGALPQSSKEYSASRFLQSLETLYQEAVEAAAVFNQYVPETHRISVHCLGAKAGDERGFLLLTGDLKAECTLDRKAHHIVCQITAVKSFRVQRLAMVSFQAVADNYGSLRFRSQEGLLLDLDLVLQRVFEVLMHATGVRDQ